MAKESGLDLFELDLMSIGMVLEHIDLYFEMKRPKDNEAPKVVKATQADINSMLKI